MLRVGRKLLRTLYIQVGDEPSDTDIFIGIMDDPQWADYVVRVVNERAETDGYFLLARKREVL